MGFRARLPWMPPVCAAPVIWYHAALVPNAAARGKNAAACTTAGRCSPQALFQALEAHGLSRLQSELAVSGLWHSCWGRLPPQYLTRFWRAVQLIRLSNVCVVQEAQLAAAAQGRQLPPLQSVLELTGATRMPQRGELPVASAPTTAGAPCPAAAQGCIMHRVRSAAACAPSCSHRAAPKSSFPCVGS